MAKHEDEPDFFAGKRPWSVIKDRILQQYMHVYLAKVHQLRRRIVLIDGYAGPGKFDDGSIGSPIYMLREAEQFVPNNYEAIFINKDRAYDTQLRAHLAALGPWQGKVMPRFGDSAELVPEIASHLANYTTFLYLDPFGIKGCGFNFVEPFLTRNPAYSTEILLTMSMPVIHRLAAAKPVAAGKITDKIKSNHATLTTTLGTDAWRAIMFDPALPPRDKEWGVARLYQAQLRKFMPYVGMCPVHDTQASQIKYFMLFASRHSDALLLLNDIMAKAYFQHMHNGLFAGTLFEQTDWRAMRSAIGLVEAIDPLVIEAIAQTPGRARSAYWAAIVAANFMQYTAAEYRDAVARLSQAGRIVATLGPTKRLNDDSILRLAGQ